jgi:hypothetical protein
LKNEKKTNIEMEPPNFKNEIKTESHFWRKREPKPNLNCHLENDANWNQWFPLKYGNWPTLVFS